MDTTTAQPGRAPGSSSTFSPATRSEWWNSLEQSPADLVVVGGGITGVGIAYEAAGRGLRVVLVEAGDFGRGTSSRSSRLIHGGLRYLETYDFRLVFEALAERGLLLRLAPHLVRPLAFLYPVFAGASVGMWKLRAGMWLYDTLALARGLGSHRIMSRRGALGREPALRPEGLRGAALYYDAQVDDARLTLAVARAASAAGAITIPHAAVVDFIRGADGSAGGVRVRDAVSGATADIPARLVISATGPWTDELRSLLDPASTPRLRPTKGVHLQLRGERVGNQGALTFRSPVDGRVMFVLPWGKYTYVGTTDTDHPGSPADSEADRDDVEYLLASVNAVFPSARLTRADVLSTWTGIRPLVAPTRKRRRLSAGQTSREHEIWREPRGVLCIAGGKLTTYRVMARDAVDDACAILAREHGVEAGFFASGEIPLPGAPNGDWDGFIRSVRTRAERLGLESATADHLAHAYGTDADSVLDLIQEDQELARPILPPHPYVWAEIPHVVRAEMALTLEDVLRRRLHLFYDDLDGGVAVAPEVAGRMAEEEGIDWSAAEVARQMVLYTEAVHRTRHALGREAPRDERSDHPPPSSSGSSSTPTISSRG